MSNLRLLMDVARYLTTSKILQILFVGDLCPTQLCTCLLQAPLRGWRNTVGSLIEICWLKRAHHRPQFTGTCVKHSQSGTVSSNSRFQTVLSGHVKTWLE